MRGEALHRAVARIPAKFEVLFVDAMGHPAQAEDIDVFVERCPDGATSSNEGRDTATGTGDAPAPTSLAAENDSSRVESVGRRGRRNASPSRRLTNRSPRRGGRTLSGKDYKMLDAPTRQRHLQLWASRQAADKLVARQAMDATHEGGDAKKKKKDAVAVSRTSFVHELSVDPFGFAFGGVDPGTLHAHGKLYASLAPAPSPRRPFSLCTCCVP